MNIASRSAILVIAGLVFAGCGKGTTPPPTTVPAASASTIAPPLAASAELVTTTSICRPAVDPAEQLRADQATLDSLIGGRRQAASAVDQIQLVIDNAGRQVDIAKRWRDQKQVDYDHALAEFQLSGWDTAHDRLVTAERYLADAKDVVASWEAVRTKALADLARGKATLGDWDSRIAEAQRAVTADKAAVATPLTCS